MNYGKILKKIIVKIDRKKTFETVVLKFALFLVIPLNKMDSALGQSIYL